MFSHPLINTDETIPISETSYKKEITEIIEKLHHKNKKLRFLQEVITYENLENVIKRKPKILHLICHGGYDKKTN